MIKGKMKRKKMKIRVYDEVGQSCCDNSDIDYCYSIVAVLKL